jgi:hypothetical protein
LKYSQREAEFIDRAAIAALTGLITNPANEHTPEFMLATRAYTYGIQMLAARRVITVEEKKNEVPG